MINPKKKKKVKMKSIDYILFYTILVLLAIGIIMVYSASSYYSMNETGSITSYLKEQLLATVLGLIAMAVTMSIDYHKLKKIVWIAYIVTALLLLLVKAFPAVKGAQRWIMLGPLSFQPSELAKYVLVILLAVILAGKGEQIKEFKKGVLVPLGFAFFYALLVIIQKNLTIIEIDDVPIEQAIDNVLVQDKTTGRIMKRSTDQLLADIGGVSCEVENSTFSVKIGK